MTLGERIKKVRRSLDLTQREFGERISIKQNSVAQIEMGRNTSDQTVFSICREFNVNETWLRTGEGEMFVPSPEESIDEFVRAHGLDSLDRQIILEFIKLKPEDREAVKKYVRNLSQHISPAVPAFAPAHIPGLDLTLEQEADQYAAKAAALARKQFLSEKNLGSEASSAKGSDAG